MTTALAPMPDTIDPALIERVLLHGDLRQLSPAQKISYYKAVCDSVGLNPLTQPFQYIVLNGKEVLYAKRDATDQLRALHQISVTIKAREIISDCYVVTSCATKPDGRADESTGVVSIFNLKGEGLANAMMKAETKSKRRVTLSICGLGMLDETEVASIQADAQTYTVEAPAPDKILTPAAARELLAMNDDAKDGDPVDRDASPLPADALFVEKVTKRPTKNVNVTKFTIRLSDGREVGTIRDKVAALAEEVCQLRQPVRVKTEHGKYGEDLLEMHRVLTETQQIEAPVNPGEPLPF